MNIHYILHADFEGLGSIETWAHNAGHKINGTLLHRGESLPNSIADLDMIISMGGPQSASQLQNHPELNSEIKFIEACIKANKKVLGICLGAQIISLTLGGSVVKCSQKEIGLFPIYKTQHGTKDEIFSHLPDTLNVMHWHGDMCVLPSSCKILASTNVCEAQVFTYNNNTYGFQCHLEFTPKVIDTMIENSKSELAEGGDLVQSIATLREVDCREMNSYFDSILTKLAG